MVNEIEKLNKVIGSLEEQATRVTEFNGILASVNEARSEIESSKKILKNASAEHQRLTKLTIDVSKELLKRLVKIEQKLANLEQGQDKCLQKISELKFLTPEKFEEGRKAIDAATNESARGLAQKIDDANQAHQSSLKTLKFITVFGILVLAIGIAFLARN
jgi:septal ring factor EnvC (AmiA/AmiB activator)